MYGDAQGLDASHETTSLSTNPTGITREEERGAVAEDQSVAEGIIYSALLMMAVSYSRGHCGRSSPALPIAATGRGERRRPGNKYLRRADEVRRQSFTAIRMADQVVPIHRRRRREEHRMQLARRRDGRPDWTHSAVGSPRAAGDVRPCPVKKETFEGPSRGVGGFWGGGLPVGAGSGTGFVVAGYLGLRVFQVVGVFCVRCGRGGIGYRVGVFRVGGGGVGVGGVGSAGFRGVVAGGGVGVGGGWGGGVALQRG